MVCCFNLLSNQLSFCIIKLCFVVIIHNKIENDGIVFKGMGKPSSENGAIYIVCIINGSGLLPLGMGI